jgi:hypothetical protein
MRKLSNWRCQSVGQMNRRVYWGSLALAVTALAALGLYLLLRDSGDGQTERARAPVPALASDLPYESSDPEGMPLPRECEPRRIASVLLEFLEALNHGDHRARRFIAPDPEFNGWSVRAPDTGERVFVKTPNSKLFGYLRRRHEQGERLGRLEIAVGPAPTTSLGPFSGAHGGAPAAAFDFKLSRTASDLRERGIRTQLGSGKAGINCRTGRIFLWAQGWGLTPPNVLICPKATIEPTWLSAVACAPGYRGVNQAVEVRLP